MTTTAPANRGVTLVETLVAAVTFAGLLALIVMINRVSHEAMQKTDVHAETFRRAAIAVDQIRRELLGARLDTDHTTASLLVYQRPPEAGALSIQPSGAILYTSPVSTIAVNGAGDLLRVDGASGKTRRLAPLGNGGQIAFMLRDARLLHVAVRSAVTDPYHRVEFESVTDLAVDVFLGNQP